MFQRYFLVAFLLTILSANSQDTKKPKLIIGIIVDQMRAEYLYRFQENYTENGFKRLMKEGLNVKNLHYNYLPTMTAPGHSSVYSGTTPTNHGIVSNSWYDRNTKKEVYCAEDPNALMVGQKGMAKITNSYSMSPKNLMVNNFADELKLFSSKKAKVVGISLKDRGAIFPSGHLADYAFWYNSETGDFITSSYYAQKLPSWLIDFNHQKNADKMLEETWTPLLSIEKYTHSEEDNAPFEFIFKGKTDATFPYDLKKLRAKNGNFKLLSQVPQGNTILTQLAIASIKGEQLGQDSQMDLLTISYSSTDIIGHCFGIRSKEIEDTYVRLDREIATLLDFLDSTVGKNEYTLFLTADHAGNDNPIFLENNRLPGFFFDTNKIKEGLNAHLILKFGEKDYISYMDVTQIYLHEEVRFDQKVLEEIILYLKRNVSEIKDIYVPNFISSTSKNKLINEFFSNSHHSERSGDILLNFLPGGMGTLNFGTTHFNSYNSDTHVPMLWYGVGFKSSRSIKKHTINQIVPTLCMLFDIPLPNASYNVPISE